MCSNRTWHGARLQITPLASLQRPEAHQLVFFSLVDMLSSTVRLLGFCFRGYTFSRPKKSRCRISISFTCLSSKRIEPSFSRDMYSAHGPFSGCSPGLSLGA